MLCGTKRSVKKCAQWIDRTTQLHARPRRLATPLFCCWVSAPPRPPCTPWLRHRVHPGYATVYTAHTESFQLAGDTELVRSCVCRRWIVYSARCVRRKKNKARVLFVHTQNVGLCRSNVTCNFARCLPIIRVLRSIGLSMPRYDVWQRRKICSISRPVGYCRHLVGT